MKVEWKAKGNERCSRSVRQVNKIPLNWSPAMQPRSLPFVAGGCDLDHGFFSQHSSSSSSSNNRASTAAELQQRRRVRNMHYAQFCAHHPANCASACQWARLRQVVLPLRYAAADRFAGDGSAGAWTLLRGIAGFGVSCLGGSARVAAELTR
jgi:hypothetical protein